ncbi:MAG TPA: right-handed parallel beta-helix repeat-containing protein [Fibrobacteria bacterium]|nr:right-handed parallel beta-helix repeat-containing protein [Fibrobacteria bacterium]
MRTPKLLAKAACLAAAFAAATDARTYYVSPSGDDQSEGSASKPWKTLAKASGTRYSAGDSILLERGGVWRETFEIQSSGQAARPIVIGAYSTGSAPEILGTDPVSGTLSSGMRRAKVARDSAVQAVFQGRRPLPVARFPDSGWIIATAVAGKTTITAPSLQGVDWKGASIHVRTTHWSLETRFVTSTSGNTVTFAPELTYTLNDSVRFYLTNHPKGATSSTESWSHSPADSTLQWRDAAGNKPSVEVSKRNYGVYGKGVDHIVVSDLAIFGTSAAGIYLKGVGNKVQRCNILYPGLVGVQLDGRDANYRENLIAGATNTGLLGIGARHSIVSNRIRRNALVWFLGPRGMGSGCCGGAGMVVTGDSILISRNTLDSIGYAGISFRGINSLVEANTVSQVCLTTDDGGGIYTFAGGFEKPGSAGSVIRGNHVRDVVGNGEGLRSSATQGHGIYLDHTARDIVIESNVVTRSDYGILFNHTRNVVVRKNIIYDNKANLKFSVLDVAEDAVNNIVDSNILGATNRPWTEDGALLDPLEGSVYKPNSANVSYSYSRTQAVPMATFKGNSYCYDNLGFAHCNTDGRTSLHADRLKDPSSSGSEILRYGSLASAPDGWKTPSSQTMTRYADKNCPTGSSCMLLKATPGTSASGLSLVSKIADSIKGSAWWRFSFQARAPSPNQHLSAIVKVGGQSHRVQFSNLDTNWAAHGFMFKTSPQASTVTVELYTQKTDTTLWIGPLSIRSVAATVAEKLPTARIFYNGTESKTESILVGSWFTPWGNAISRIALDPNRGTLLFPTDTTSKTSSVKSRSPARVPFIRRAGAGFVVEGLSEPARLLDLSGRVVAHLEPDASGRARIATSPAASVVLLNSPGVNRLLHLPR